jgi:hypothetical protein
MDLQTLQDAICRTKALDGDENRTRSLNELVLATGEIDEASFHDAVSRNLKRGRFLILIVDDGIREGVEGMTEFLQQYAGFHLPSPLSKSLCSRHLGVYCPTARPRQDNQHRSRYRNTRKRAHYHPTF